MAALRVCATPITRAVQHTTLPDATLVTLRQQGDTMRSLKTLIAAGVLAASIGAPAALMPTVASAATTPVVYASGTGGFSHRSVRPSWILIGMGGAPGAHIGHWSTWDKGEPNPHASANGSL